MHSGHLNIAAKAVVFALIFIALPCMTFSQASGDLAQKLELFAELQTDYAILIARYANTEAEYSISAFCGQRLAEPAFSARRNYCNQKNAEMRLKLEAVKTEVANLSERIRELDLQIRQLQTPKR